MIIYKIINKINNKIYIGQTIQPFRIRMNHHFSSKDGMCLHKAMRKYGRENFIAEEICSARNKEDLDYLEIFFIQYYQSNISKNGYNVAIGGTVNAMTGRKHTEETKIKMSLASKGKPKSPEHIEALSKAKKGKIFSAEARKNMSNSRKGRKKAGNLIICNQTGEIFISVCEASRKTDIYRTKIFRQLTGKVKETKCPLTFSYMNNRDILCLK